jgi:hypothetical protein
MSLPSKSIGLISILNIFFVDLWILYIFVVDQIVKLFRIHGKLWVPRSLKNDTTHISVKCMGESPLVVPRRSKFLKQQMSKSTLIKSLQDLL